jgi:hypothetical protein
MARPRKTKSGVRIDPKTNKAETGRPSAITDEVIRKLEDALKNDFTVTEACSYAGIGHTTYYDHIKANPDFADKMTRAKKFVFFASKRNIANAIINEGSVEDSWKLLERRQKKLYSLRQELTGKDGENLIPEIGEKEKEKLDNLLENDEV